MKNLKKTLTAALVLGSVFVTGAFAGGTVISATLRPDIKVVIDGATQNFKDAKGSVVYPVSYNNTTYLPVRSIGSVMGKNVGWDEGTQTITLSNETAPPENANSSRTVATDNFKIEITDYKVIPAGAKGNEYGEKPVIAFWYKTTNISGDEISPSMAWIFTFDAVQDNNPNAINEIDYAGLPDSRFREAQSEKIKKGGTVECAAAYELDDLTTPVVLTARDGIVGDVIAEMTFEIAGK